MHASRQDLEVLMPSTGLVRPVFDTQIAAALTGLPAQIGYAEAVRRLLGQQLAKSHPRTDWSRRPLSSEQLEYALDDVRYLLPLAERLEEELGRLGRLEWLAEELSTLEDAGAPGTDPDDAWRRLKGLNELDPARVRLARALADVPGMPPAVVKHSGEWLLAQLRGADIPDPPPPPPGRPRPDPAKAALVKKLAAIIQATARELNLAPEVLATRRDLELLADGSRDVAPLHGWRRRAVGERLLAAL